MKKECCLPISLGPAYKKIFLSYYTNLGTNFLLDFFERGGWDQCTWHNIIKNYHEKEDNFRQVVMMGVSVGKQQLVFSQSDSIPGRDPGAEKCSCAPAHSQRSSGTQYPNQPVSVLKIPSEMEVLLRYNLLTLFTLLTWLRLLTWFTLLTWFNCWHGLLCWHGLYF